MKKSNHDTTEPIDRQHYKKRYLVRILEEQEAEQEIKDFEPPEPFNAKRAWDEIWAEDDFETKMRNPR